MHVHILIKVWDHKQADCNTYTCTATQGHASFHITIQKSEADMVSQVDMYTCTDACTHFNQGMGLVVG